MNKIITMLILSGMIGCSATAARPGFEMPELEDTVSPLMKYDSGVLAAADGDIKGEVYYRVYRLPLPQRKRKRLRTCYLQHGISVDQGMVDSAGWMFNSFVQGYFGEHTVRRLLESVCSEVIVTMQESNITTVLEMTLRTEKFTKDIVCPDARDRDFPNGFEDKQCAYIGHSKGGAVAFNIARRCMEKTSLLGEDGCGRIAEIYSANGIIQGSMSTFTARGLYELHEQGELPFGQRLHGCLVDSLWDIYTPYKPAKTNPMWLAVSPAAPMEGGVPLYVINDTALRKTGWLKADFAASATYFVYAGKDRESLFGCRKEGCTPGMNNIVCTLFGWLTGFIHTDDYRTVFELGLQEMRNDRRLQNPQTGTTEYLNRSSWEGYQISDGLADFNLALNSCRKGLQVRENRAVQDCRVYSDLNHMAADGSAPEAIENIVKQLSH